MNHPFLLSQAYAFVTVLLWSTAYVFTKVALQYFSASSLGLLRCGVAALCLLLALGPKRFSRPPLKQLPLFLLSGAAGFGLYILAFNIGSSLLNPTTSCVIISMSPIITALLARLAFGEKLNAGRWAATGLSFGGVLLMFLWDGAFTLSAGLLWMLGAAVLISIYNVLQRGLARRYNPLQITAYSFFFGSLMLLGFLPEASAELQAAPLRQVGLVVFLGIFPSAVAYVAWSKALAITAKTSSVTNYMFLTPFLALLLEYAVMGAWPGTATFAGGGVILLSLLLFSLAGRREGGR